MWASKTDYSRLYSKYYFEENKQKQIYDKGDFEEILFKFCNSRGIKTLVDVGSFCGPLKLSAESVGMSFFSCGSHSVSEEEIHFDLLMEDSKAAKALYDIIDSRVGPTEYVTICLDVLEHVDIEDVGSALWNLHTIAGDFVVISISTRPSGRGNRYHSTILPLATWKHLFELSGFEIVDPHFCSERRRIIPLVSEDTDLHIVSHWAQGDIFGDRVNGEPTYLLLRKAERPRDRANWLRQLDVVLDIAYRKQKRLAFNQYRLQAIGFNISHFQDFLNIRPLLDIIARGQCSLLIRKDALKADEMSMVVSYFERNGGMVFIYHTVADIDWRLLSIRTLVSAAESSAAVNHILSSQIVEAAKLQGIKTILLQHGIWIEPMQDREITFASDTILTWGTEHERFFAEGLHPVAARSSPYAALSGTHFRLAGSAKFHDSLLETNSEVLRWRLGADISRFDECVLVGTNLKWNQHLGERSDVLNGIHRMIQASPEKLFVIKPHPSERHFEYANLRAPNTIILDDILLGCIDLPISRLLGGISTIVSSLSTLLLDGAILGRRCIQYDTGNKFHYKFCKPISADDLHLAIKNPAVASLKCDEFTAYYNDAQNDQFYEVFADTASAAAMQARSAARYTDLKSVEDSWISFLAATHSNITLEQEKNALLTRNKELEQERNAVHARNEELVRSRDLLSTQIKSVEDAQYQFIARSEEEIVRLSKEITRLNAVLADMNTSMSWRITAPYRWLGRRLRQMARFR